VYLDELQAVPFGTKVSPFVIAKLPLTPYLTATLIPTSLHVLRRAKPIV
jgi:hypothetical protein